MMMRSLRALRPEFAVPYDGRMSHVFSWRYSTWHHAVCVLRALFCLWRLGHMHTRPQVANYPTLLVDMPRFMRRADRHVA